jgi:uncharacterized membrane protein YeiH
VKLLLILVYGALNYACSLDPFKGADFMYTVFFSASCCVLYALLAKQIDNLFAELFIIFQVIALITYALMGVSYAYFNSIFQLELTNLNTALLIADIIALTGVMLGDRWLYNRAS